MADFTNNANGVNLGFPRRSHWVKSVGTIKVTTLFVDFSDAPATRTPEDVFKQYISPSSENFLGTISYGKQIINFDTQFQWLRMSKRSTEYGWSALTGDLHRAYNREAALLADPKVDFSTTDVLLVVTNPDAAAISNGPASPSIPGRGIILDGKEILNFTNSGKDLVGWNGLWFPHEFGHLLNYYAKSTDPKLMPTTAGHALKNETTSIMFETGNPNGQKNRRVSKTDLQRIENGNGKSFSSKEMIKNGRKNIGSKPSGVILK